jgi:hypothetical protein
MAASTDFSSMTLKFGVFAFALGASIAMVVNAIWGHHLEQMLVAVAFAALTLFMANSIEKDLVEKYNSKNN